MAQDIKQEELLHGKVGFAFDIQEGTYCATTSEQQVLVQRIVRDLSTLIKNNLTEEEITVLRPIPDFRVEVCGKRSNHHRASSSRGYDAPFQVYISHEQYASFQKKPGCSLSVTRKVPGKSVLPDELGYHVSESSDSTATSGHLSAKVNSDNINNTQFHIFFGGPRDGTVEITGFDKKLAIEELQEFLPWLDFTRINDRNLSSEYFEYIVRNLRSMVFFNKLPE